MLLVEACRAKIPHIVVTIRLLGLSCLFVQTPMVTAPTRNVPSEVDGNVERNLTCLTKRGTQFCFLSGIVAQSAAAIFCLGIKETAFLE
jgi:hypothetical protein